MDSLGIGQVAAQTGLSPDTLRYYERLGLLRPARDPGGRRRYSETDVVWLTFVVRLRATGMPLADLQTYAALALEGASTLRARREIVEAHAARLQAQMQLLDEAFRAVQDKLTFYDRLERMAQRETT
ncbi:MerR family transcriptional regulator [Deinococcus hopiensis]|uniref:DNA-binding transcriptional regulator, MerR family n=1 Tax=Deinococcus hopiensis KR-140 TaxID=695939 RepID=A0A1W1VD06_9DEIO|nr:MerR family transcriptional regulator [Deinococcus hopiensis]SMB90931.1 DNA-binding transcriptional regulator, MerR family [Deinococcus hopiensis KR-140]